MDKILQENVLLLVQEQGGILTIILDYAEINVKI